MATLATLVNSTGTIRRCSAKCYNAKTKTCHCLCGGVNHGVGRDQAIDQTRAYFSELDEEISQLATPEMQFRKIEILRKVRLCGRLLHPNQSLIFYQPPMNAETKKIAVTLAISACLAILTGCTPPRPPPPPPLPATRVVIIYDSAELSTADATTLNSPELRPYMENHYWFRAVDKKTINQDNIQPPELHAYLTEANGKKLPRIILADDNDNVIKAAQLPSTPSKVIDFCRGTTP